MRGVAVTPSTKQIDMRPLARARIADGSLPCIIPREILAGYGTGEPCDLCGVPVTRSEAEYQIIAWGTSEGLTYRFHTLCQAAWEIECLNVAEQSKQAGG
jgi:hypothetical protein